MIFDVLLSKESIAIVAVILTLVGYSQYFKNIFSGKTKPHAFSWLIWASLTGIAYFAQISDGAGPGAWVTGLTAVISFIIVGFALFKGENNITRSDWFTFIAALSAIPAWLITNDALLSVIIITAIDALGFYPTFRKSWMKPFEETAIHYFLAGVKFLLAVIALENYTVITVLYPFSLVVMNALFVMLLLIRRNALKIPEPVS